MVNERMRREAALREPRTVQPIAMKRPLEKAGLDDGDETAGENRDGEQMEPSGEMGTVTRTIGPAGGKLKRFRAFLRAGQNASPPGSTSGRDGRCEPFHIGDFIVDLGGKPHP